MKGSSDTKQRLLDAALSLFTEKGFAGASTREIVEKSGVTKPTLYYYFGSKDNLYRSLLEESFNRFNREIERITAEDLPPRVKLLKVVHHYIDYCREFPQEVKLILISMYRSDTFAPDVDIAKQGRPGIEAIAEIIREGIEGGLFIECNPLQLSLQLIGMIHIQIQMQLKETKDLPSSRPEDILDTFLRGIGK